MSGDEMSCDEMSASDAGIRTKESHFQSSDNHHTDFLNYRHTIMGDDRDRQAETTQTVSHILKPSVTDSISDPYIHTEKSTQILQQANSMGITPLRRTAQMFTRHSHHLCACFCLCLTLTLDVYVCVCVAGFLYLFVNSLSVSLSLSLCGFSRF